MIKLLDGSKTGVIDYLYVMTMILIAAGASLFARKYGDIQQPVTWVAILFTFIIGLKHRVKIADKNLFWALIVFTFYFFFASVFNRYINIGFLIYWVITILITFVICKSYGIRFFVHFETVVFHLSIISLIIWIFCLVLPDTTKDVLLNFRFSESFTEDVDAINVIFYTYLDRNFDADIFHSFFRNSGFAFEPGAFASFLSIAIACNIIRNNSIKLWMNIPLYVFLANMFSTESTTAGMMVITIIVFFILLNNKSKYRFLWLIILIPVIYYIFSLEFVGEKLQDELTVSGGRLQSDSGGASRLMSFRFLMFEFITHPIFGLAGNPNTWYASMGYEGALHSGIGHLLADFGIVMTSVVLFAQINTARSFKKGSGKLGYLTIVALICSMVSYSLWKHPVFIFFMIYGLFIQAPPVRTLKITKK